MYVCVYIYIYLYTYIYTYHVSHNSLKNEVSDIFSLSIELLDFAGPLEKDAM